MFNVYPVMIRYTRTPHAGVLAGLPLRCSFGVENFTVGALAYEDLIRNNPNDSFRDFEVNYKK